MTLWQTSDHEWGLVHGQTEAVKTSSSLSARFLKVTARQPFALMLMTAKSLATIVNAVHIASFAYWIAVSQGRSVYRNVSRLSPRFRLGRSYRMWGLLSVKCQAWKREPLKIAMYFITKMSVIRSEVVRNLASYSMPSLWTKIPALCLEFTNLPKISN